VCELTSEKSLDFRRLPRRATNWSPIGHSKFLGTKRGRNLLIKVRPDGLFALRAHPFGVALRVIAIAAARRCRRTGLLSVGGSIARAKLFDGGWRDSAE